MSLVKNSSTPGEVLKELYMEPAGLDISTLALKIDLEENVVRSIVDSRLTLSAKHALHLARFFSTTPEFWMDLQRNHNLSLAKESCDLSNITPLKDDMPDIDDIH